MSNEDTIVGSEGQDGPGGNQAADSVVGDAASETPAAESAVETAAVDAEIVPETATVAIPEEPKTPVTVSAPIAPKTPSQKRLEELEAKIDEETFDPYTKEGKQVIKEHARVAGKVEAEPLQQQIQSISLYSREAAELGVPVSALEKVWTEVEKSIPAKHKTQEVVEYAYQQRLEEMKKAKATPVKPRVAATPVIAPGQVLPRGAGSVPPQPVAEDTRTVEERVLAGDKKTLDDFKGAYEGFFKR